MKKKFLLCIGIILSVLIVITVLLFTKGYYVSRKNIYIPYDGAADVYNASKEELTELDNVSYPEIFGEVKNEKEAALIAAKIIEEIYGNDEAPYIVKYNNNAGAWIVKGSLPIFHIGGVATVAIDSETGEVLMMIHTK
ncbi:MAG: hypothetical protein E7660_00210 [Ruminococcaceae bacterium]|nr:hypothetical protein [Oscillospiraceae bacterium]